MTETLLSLSNILLYGRRVTDLSVVDPNVAATDVTAGSRKNISSLSVSTTKVDGVRLNQNDTVLVKNQTVKTDNGIYTVPASGNWTKTTPSLNAANTSQTETETAIPFGSSLQWTAARSSSSVWAGAGAAVWGRTASWRRSSGRGLSRVFMVSATKAFTTT